MILRKQAGKRGLKVRNLLTKQRLPAVSVVFAGASLLLGHAIEPVAAAPAKIERGSVATIADLQPGSFAPMHGHIVVAAADEQIASDAAVDEDDGQGRESRP